MTLSIIIVNYNVKHFLEQCLYAVERSLCGNVEIIVVDNNSNDGSVPYLQPRFPTVQFIRNRNNLGFAKACNQGFRVATGTYILFLNPDTIIAEDSLSTCISFFERTPLAGAVGVRMIDGGGRFLKESKRSFPGPLTSLFKLGGLARLFPRSKFFSRYHLGHLAEDRTHEVDVLAGAFMMIRKDVLERTGSFDETFFMYGEDVDLSYRIQKIGYKNYYLPETTIVHFKGESTKRGSLNYVRMFYSAMSIFVQKHYGGARAGIFYNLIRLAIWFRALISGTAKFVAWIGLPVIDAAIILLSFWFTKLVWTTYIRTDIVYSEQLIMLALPAFTLVYLTVGYYAGLYNKYYRHTDLWRSTLIATMALLAAYAMLPEQYRFSRGILIFGVVLSFVFIRLIRSFMLGTGMLQHRAEKSDQPYILIAGTGNEAKEVTALLQEQTPEQTVIGRIGNEEAAASPVGTMKNVCATARSLNARELVIVTGSMSSKEAINNLQVLNGCVRVRFHAGGSHSIVGSDSGGSSGEVLSAEPRYSLANPHHRRLKRLIDVLSALFFLATIPLHVFFVRAPFRFIVHCFQVLLATRTWIGYSGQRAPLPSIRSGILTSNGFTREQAKNLPPDTAFIVDEHYAKDYRPNQDLTTIYQNYRRLGGRL
ncbi:MAG: glycosyltransferase [Chitinophagaceae bacterium]